MSSGTEEREERGRCSAQLSVLVLGAQGGSNPSWRSPTLTDDGAHLLHKSVYGDGDVQSWNWRKKRGEALNEENGRE